jgi:hypothetical protein
MKATRHSEEQIIAILKQGEAGLTTGGVIPAVWDHEQTYYRAGKRSTVKGIFAPLVWNQACGRSCLGSDDSVPSFSARQHWTQARLLLLNPTTDVLKGASGRLLWPPSGSLHHLGAVRDEQSHICWPLIFRPLDFDRFAADFLAKLSGLKQ